VRAVAAAVLRPLSERSFALDDTSLPYRHLASGTAFGKIVIAH
jgi:hypothetical protein